MQWVWVAWQSIQRPCSNSFLHRQRHAASASSISLLPRVLRPQSCAQTTWAQPSTPVPKLLSREDGMHSSPVPVLPAPRLRPKWSDQPAAERTSQSQDSTQTTTILLARIAVWTNLALWRRLSTFNGVRASYNIWAPLFSNITNCHRL